MSEQTNVIAATLAPRVINLTRLPPDKKRQLWQLIQRHNTPLTQLLKSNEFQTFKQKLEQRFGAVEISIDPRDAGGNENGISRLSEK